MKFNCKRKVRGSGSNQRLGDGTDVGLLKCGKEGWRREKRRGKGKAKRLSLGHGMPTWGVTHFLCVLGKD